MQQNQRKILPNGNVVFLLLVLNAIVMEQAIVDHSGWYKLLLFTTPLLVAALINFNRKDQ